MNRFVMLRHSEFLSVGVDLNSQKVRLFMIKRKPPRTATFPWNFSAMLYAVVLVILLIFMIAIECWLFCSSRVLVFDDVDGG